MPYKLRDFQCAGCGEPVTDRRPAGAEVFCITCAIARSVANMRQMRTRNGEFYRRWAEGMARAGAAAVQLAAIADEIDQIG